MVIVVIDVVGRLEWLGGGFVMIFWYVGLVLMMESWGCILVIRDER